MTLKNKPILAGTIFIICFLLGYGIGFVQDQPMPILETLPTQISTPTITPSPDLSPTKKAVYASELNLPTSTPLPLTSPTPTPLPAQRLLDEWRTESPSSLVGGATRYGSWEIALQTLRYNAGSTHQWVERNGQTDGTQKVERLNNLAEMEYQEFEMFVAHAYDGIIALRSPSDVGRTYRVIGAGGYIGCAIVGDAAAFNDYYHYGESILGDLRLIDYRLEEYPWIADLDNYLYYRAGGEAGMVFVHLEEGC